MKASHAKEKDEDMRLSAILSSMKEGLVMVDTRHRVMLMNQAASALLRIAPEESMGQDIRNVFRLSSESKRIPWSKSPLQKALKETTTVFGAFKDNFFCEDKEGNVFPVAFSATGLADYGTIGGVLIFNDISKEKEVDRMKTEFVSVTSHQLRTPLTAVKLFVEMLGDGQAGKLNDVQTDYVANVRESTERMIHLVNDFLNMSRLEEGSLNMNPQPTQLEDIIENIIREISLLADAKGCAVTFRRPTAKLPKIFIDPSLMRQVVYNIMTNAVKYSRKNPCRVEVKVKRDGKNIVVAVRDTGLGIPKDVQSRIFEKFFRANNAKKAQSGGSGLGLYVAKMMVEAWGGKVWFESVEGRGTTFYVTIPASTKQKRS